MDGAQAIEIGGGSRPSRLFPLGLAGSGVLHAGLLVALLTLTPIRNFVVPEPAPISVELIPSATIEAPAEPVAAPALDAAPASPATTDIPQTDQPEPRGTIDATTLYAAELLGTPAMRQVRATLPTLTSGERVVQLCNIEALEQIRRHAPDTDPDTLVGYAMSDPLISGLTLSAMGGAFRSRRQWYRIAFTCTARPTLDGVASFSFTLGTAIPQSEWDAHDLNAEDRVE